MQPSEHHSRVLLRETVLDVPADPVELLPADDGAHVGVFVKRIANLQRLELRRQLAQEGFEDRAVEEQP